MSDWKQHHANVSEKAFAQALVEGVIEELVENMRRNYGVDLSEGLPRLGLHKCMAVAMQVARAEALGFDPELLRLNATESTEQLLKLAQGPRDLE